MFGNQEKEFLRTGHQDYHQGQVCLGVGNYAVEYIVLNVES